MTIDELADLTADKLEKLSDKELDEILKPYYTVTRPEMVQHRVKQEPAQPPIYLSPQKKLALELLRENGVDVDAIIKRRKK